MLKRQFFSERHHHYYELYPCIEADFETAISETGFGKFNFILLLVAIPSGWAALLESISMSYVFPAAQCDLKLTLENKGMLNAVTYIGKGRSNQHFENFEEMY